MVLTDKFDLTTMIHSDTAVRYKISEQNSPPPEVIANLERLYRNVLFPLVKHLPGSLNVNCAYRCHKVNAKVGGKPNSQHVTGEAADLDYFVGKVRCNDLLIQAIKDLDLPIDQCIDERNLAWVHVSYREGNNRNQFFKL